MKRKSKISTDPSYVSRFRAEFVRPAAVGMGGELENLSCERFFRGRFACREPIRVSS